MMLVSEPSRSNVSTCARGAQPKPLANTRYSPGCGSTTAKAPSSSPRLQSTGEPSVVITVTTDGKAGEPSDFSTFPWTTTSVRPPKVSRPPAFGSFAAATCLRIGGMNQAMTPAAIADSPAIQKISWKALNDGNSMPPDCIVTEPRMTATTALDVDVPTERSNALSPFA